MEDRPEPVDIYVLEMLYKDLWHTVQTSFDKKLLESIRDGEIKKGWPEKELRITNSTFAFKKTYSETSS